MIGVGQHRTNTHRDKDSLSLQPRKPLLTLYPDLPAGAVRAWQQGKLFSLVHGIICTSNNNLIPGFPGLLHFILQIQHHLVHSIHLEA